MLEHIINNEILLRGLSSFKTKDDDETWASHIYYLTQPIWLYLLCDPFYTMKYKALGSFQVFGQDI